MIFGFNTDIAALGTVYHVQTEVREQPPRLESQIFVRGRCIGKRATALLDAGELDVQELARAQHRWVVEAVRGGFVDDVLQQEHAEALSIDFLGTRRLADGTSVLRFRVVSRGCATRAKVAVDWKIDAASGVLKSRPTNDAGIFEMRLNVGKAVVELDVTAQAEELEAKQHFLIEPTGTA